MWLLGAGSACCFRPLLTGKMYSKNCQRYRTSPKCAFQTSAQLRSYQALSPKQLTLQKMVVTVTPHLCPLEMTKIPDNIM